MAKWQDYTQQVDQALGSLSQGGRAAAEAFTRGSPGKSDPDRANLLFDNAVKELMKEGYDEQQAKTLLQTAYNVRRHGDLDTKDMFTADAGAFTLNPANVDALFATGPSGRENVDQITANINKFLEGLNPGSPEYQQAQVYISKRAQSAQGASSARAGLGSFGSGGAQTGQGLGGGLSAYGEGTIQADMNTKYRLQNEQLKAQGLGLLNQRDLGLKGLELGYQQMQNQQAEQAWAAQQNQNQMIGSTLGGIGGSLVSAYTGVPGLGSVGSQIGGGVASGFGGGTGPNYASMPSWTQGGGTKGSLGGSGF